MASYPPPPPPYDPRDQRRFYRDQARAQRAAWRAHMQQVSFQMRRMRRGSILGPLLLIAAGAVFFLLEIGRINSARFWTLYGHWWPLLLVAAGVVLLAEWAFDQYQLRDPQRTPYRRVVGGGVITILLILGLVGAVERHIAAGERWDNGGWHFAPENLDELLGDKHESDQTQDLALAPGGSLNVVNPRGDVTVNGTSDDGRVHISIHRQVYAQSDSEAESKAALLVPTTSFSGMTMTITEPSQEGARTDLVLTVPAATATSVLANHGDVHIASIKAPVWATSNHGDIDLSAITGSAMVRINNDGSSITAHSLGGGIEIQGRGQELALTEIVGPVTISGDFFGATHLAHINGAIHFHTSRAEFQAARLDGEAEIGPNPDLTVDQAVGPLVMNTRNHNVRLDRIAGDVSVSDRNGSIDLTAAPPMGAINLQDGNGSVSLILPERAGFFVQVNTTNGEIRTGFPLSIQGGENHKSVNGEVGSGGPQVRITTSNGDILFHPGVVQPLSTTPAATPILTLAPLRPDHALHVGKGKAEGR
ncbi:MAG: DUF4097 family beta strand repeat-containing protein [Acidobacteriaceae bacterium]|nr:DUF4097 family beta strand repeat-containing protein [Acidobacteriaceae bacterium]